jgi:hypothetical protein
MPGIFATIASALTGGDTRLVGRVEEFASGCLIQGDVAKLLGLKREDVGLLGAILAEELYRSYCASHNRECNQDTLAHFTGAVKAHETQVGLADVALQRFEAALREVAVDLTNLARQKGKFESGFTTVDGLTESLVSDALGSHALDVKSARRTAT